MPLYEYQCQTCDNRFERIERASEPQDGTCPECGAPAHRMIGVPALQFKGSGWYVNDYGTGSNGNSSQTTEKENDDATTSAESSTDSKPAKKTEKKTLKKSDAKVA